jgi:hypothetical protein
VITVEELRSLKKAYLNLLRSSDLEIRSSAWYSSSDDSCRWGHLSNLFNCKVIYAEELRSLKEYYFDLRRDIPHNVRYYDSFLTTNFLITKGVIKEEDRYGLERSGTESD